MADNTPPFPAKPDFALNFAPGQVIGLHYAVETMTNSPHANRSDHSSKSLLLRFISERDESAFEELVRRHDRIVWGVCARVLGNRCDTEDAFQQTFVLLAQKANQIRKPGSLSSWLHGVALRTATRIRNQRRHSTFEELHDARLPTEPYDEISRRHQIEQVDQQLLLLNDKYRTPLILFYFQDQTAPQIASELGLTVAAVEGRLRRGRQQLKRGLLGRGCDFAILMPFLSAVPTNTLVSSTTQYLATRASGLIPTGLLNPYRMGAITMMKKSLLIAATISFFAIVAGLHARPVTPTTNLNTETEPTTEVATSSVALIDDPDEESLTAHEALHEHLMQIHDHVYELFLSLHGA